MKNHPVNPHALAVILDEMEGDLDVYDHLADIRDHPEIYYCDHVAWSRDRGTLPLSEQAWRRSCLAA